jgi:hypothetical protein
MLILSNEAFAGCGGKKEKEKEEAGRDDPDPTA